MKTTTAITFVALALFVALSAALGAQAPAPMLLTHTDGAPTTTANAASTSLGMSATIGVTRTTSDDGRYAVINSRATDLIAGFTKSNTAADLFLFDRVSDTYKLISHVPGSTTQTGNGGSGTATISADGLWVAFTSAATNLVSGVTDTNAQSDVFLYDVASDTVSLVSKSGSNPNVTANGRTIGCQISADGRYVASYTLATDFAPGITDTNGTNDIVLYDRVTDTNKIVTHTASSTTTTFTPAGSQPDAFRLSIALSADYLVYICGGTDLVAGQVDTNSFGDLFCYDIAADTNTLITHTFGSTTTAATAGSYSGAISADGNYVLYHHNASNLVNGTDTNSNFDLFLWERSTNTNILVSHVAGLPTTASTSITVSGPPPLPSAYNGVISADGRYCAYFHGANDLVSGQSGSGSNLFLFDRVTGTNTLVTHQPGTTTVAIGGMGGMGGMGDNLDAAMSADGRYVAYVCAATNIVTGVTDTNGVNDIFLFDRTSGDNVLLSRNLASATTTANGTPSRLTITLNSAMVSFQSTATDMAVTDTNALSDIFGVNLGGVLGDANPDTGTVAGGTSVTLTGVGLSGVTALRFGGTNATSFTVISDTQINATAPAHAGGAVSIELDTAFVTTSFSGLFTYGSPPGLTSVTPNTGNVAGGTSVTLSGSGFTGATSVTFGGQAATNLTVVSDTQITCTTPAHAAGAASVIVTTPGGSNGANTLFTYVPNTPTVTSVNPTFGTTAGGTSVTITGTDFTGASGVTFGGTTAGFTVDSATQITATTPAHAAGAVSVVVTTAGGSNGANSLYTYIAPPTLAGVSPNSGPSTGGTSVTLTGTSFTGATSVTFDGTGVSFTVVSATSITCTTPAHSVGAVSVIVTNAVGSNSANSAYTYTTPAPTVTGVNPSSGPDTGGTAITITGTDFIAVSSVTVGGVAATGVVTVNSTTITCTTPAHAQGTVSVEVATATGASAGNSLFTYFVPATPQEIEITRSGVGIAAGGTDTINGAQATSATLLTYTISNIGGIDLTVVSPVSVTGDVNCAVVVNQQPAALVIPGGVTTLALSVTPSASGVFSVNVSVVSDDPNQNPYNWTITGVASSAPGGGGSGGSSDSGGGGCAAAGSSWAGLLAVALFAGMAALARRRRISS